MYFVFSGDVWILPPCNFTVALGVTEGPHCTRCAREQPVDRSILPSAISPSRKPTRSVGLARRAVCNQAHESLASGAAFVPVAAGAVTAAPSRGSYEPSMFSHLSPNVPSTPDIRPRSQPLVPVYPRTYPPGIYPGRYSSSNTPMTPTRRHRLTCLWPFLK